MQKWEHALTELRTFLTHEPEYPDAHYMAAVCHLNLDHLPPAREAAQDTLRLAPEYHPAYYVLSYAAFKEHQYADALRFINQAIALKNDDAEYHAHKACILHNAHEFTRALQHAEIALGLDPENDTALAETGARW